LPRRGDDGCKGPNDRLASVRFRRELDHVLGVGIAGGMALAAKKMRI
jgi:hypothetical protein